MTTDTELASSHLRSVLNGLQEEGPLDVDSLSERLWKEGLGVLAAPLLITQALHFLRLRGLVLCIREEGPKLYEITQEGRQALATEPILPEYEPQCCRS